MILTPIKEMDIYGVFVPPVLVWGVISLVAVKIIHHFLARQNFYRAEVDTQIFDISLFVILISLLSFFVS